ncbi:MAG: GNAT family N-acetyltransferase, partial [Verrucomicrobiota bacterium]
LGRIFVGPYLAMEPDLAFVLEDDQGVCGYLLGALDSRKFFDAYVSTWLPAIQAAHPEPTGDPARWTPAQKVHNEYYHPDLFLPDPYAEYPSHLHIDLLPRAQGRRLGGDMMRNLLAALAAKGSPGVHLGMGEDNARAEKFYRKLGFQELARNRGVLYLGLKLSRSHSESLPSEREV